MGNTLHKQSFLQVAKTFITFSEKKRSEERPKKHKSLRKTVSLGSSGIEMTKESNVLFDPNDDANNGKNQVLKETKETNKSQNHFKTKYYSQKVRGGRDQNEHTLLPKHRVKLKQLPDKPGRRKFSLKGVRHGESKLQRKTYNLSCPDLTSRQEDLGRSYDILDTVDSLDRNTVHMFRDKQYLETELIEI